MLDFWYIVTIPQQPLPFSRGTLLDFVVLFCVLLGGTVVHELFHVIAMRKYDAPMPEGVGVGIYWFSLALYTDTHSSLLLPRKQRMVISGVGILGQMLWTIMLSPLLLASDNHIFRDILLITNILILGTFNPFLKMDGYWVICDLLGVSNLQNKLLLAINHRFTKKHFNPFSTLSIPTRAAIVLYAVVFVLFFIAFLTGLCMYVAYLLSNFDVVFVQKIANIASGHLTNLSLVAFELARDGLLLLTTCSGLLVLLAKLFKRIRA